MHALPPDRIIAKIQHAFYCANSCQNGSNAVKTRLSLLLDFWCTYFQSMLKFKSNLSVMETEISIQLEHPIQLVSEGTVSLTHIIM